MFQSMVLGAADMVAKVLLKHAEMWAQKKVMDLMGYSTQKATQSAADVAAAISYAAVAAIAAASSVAGVPIIGPALAVAAAASMTAAMAPYIALASFDSGGIMPHGGYGVNLSGKPERVLDPRQTENFEKMVNNSSSSSAVTHNHYHSNITQHMNGYDHAGLKRELRGHADTILDIVRQGYRGGKLSTV